MLLVAMKEEKNMGVPGVEFSPKLFHKTSCLVSFHILHVATPRQHGLRCRQSASHARQVAPQVGRRRLFVVPRQGT